MRTILETLTIAAEHFDKAAVDSPRLTAELLLAHVLGCRRIDLYLKFDQPLASEERDRFGVLYKRRLAREPLQYLVGSTNFCGLEIEVNPAVLIPRPETEELVERVKALIIRREMCDPHMLDIGTGSGCIALALAHSMPHARIEGIDVSSGAIDTAKHNAARLGIMNVTFRVADLFDDAALDGEFDVIVSNPPYISVDEMHLTQAEVRDYEPRVATTDHADGLTFYRRIAAVAAPHLRPNGVLAMEIGAGQAHAVEAILGDEGWNVEIYQDAAGIARIVVGTREAVGEE